MGAAANMADEMPRRKKAMMYSSLRATADGRPIRSLGRPVDEGQPRPCQFRISPNGSPATGLWAVILGGSGFGLATAKRLAKAGLNILIGHKDKEGTVETVIKPHFDEIRQHGVELATHNVNLFDDEGRGEVFESIAEKAGPARSICSCIPWRLAAAS